MADGHLNKCKDCTKKDQRNREVYQADSVLSSRLATCEKNPTKHRAHKVVEAAINAGVLEKPDHCSGCGRPASETRISAHHYDYGKPLDVIWVCARCHRPLDANRRRLEGNKGYGKSREVILVYDGHEICSFESIADAAESVGRKPSSISQCLSGKSSTCAGYGWRYKEENNGCEQVLQRPLR